MDHWPRMWARQEARADIARRWWALAGGRPGLAVADVGCGPGFTASLYARWGASRVLAVDANASALAFARARGVPTQVELRQHDITARPLADDVDVAFVTNVLHHIRDVEGALRNVRARTLLVGEFDPEGEGDLGPPLDERIAPDEMRRAMRAAGWGPSGVRRLDAESYAVVARPGV